MADATVERERARNLWSSFERKFAPIARAARLETAPSIGVDQIGGLAAAKEEVLNYACVATHPEVYERWGTFAPSALLLIGRAGVGKALLAEMLATRSATPFLRIDVPRLVVEVMHRGGQVAELLEAWSHTLDEMPPTTVFFEELEFSQAEEIGARRPDLPIGPIMDFLLDLIDRAIAAQRTLVVGSTSHPDSLRTAFLTEDRFERVVEVSPLFPGDVVEALRIHQAAAEKRAGRPLFEAVDWVAVVSQDQGPSPGEWIRLLHAALRHKARCEATGEPDEERVTTADLLQEVERLRQARKRLPSTASGVYL
jgi:ATP-dependent 26S proteasome regulatory subunit